MFRVNARSNSTQNRKHSQNYATRTLFTTHVNLSDVNARTREIRVQKASPSIPWPYGGLRVNLATPGMPISRLRHAGHSTDRIVAKMSHLVVEQERRLSFSGPQYEFMSAPEVGLVAMGANPSLWRLCQRLNSSNVSVVVLTRLCSDSFYWGSLFNHFFTVWNPGKLVSRVIIY